MNRSRNPSRPRQSPCPRRDRLQCLPLARAGRRGQFRNNPWLVGLRQRAPKVVGRRSLGSVSGWRADTERKRADHRSNQAVAQPFTERMQRGHRRRQNAGHFIFGRFDNIDAATQLDVFDPLANIVVILAGEISFHELPQKIGRAVVLQIGGFGARQTAAPDPGQPAGG